MAGLLFGLIAVALGWSVVWFYARSQAEQNLDAWIVAEKRDGRLWACADRRFDGFPVRIGLTCVAPSFAEADNPAFAGRLGALRAEAALGSGTPSGRVTIELTGPLSIGQASGQPATTVSWSKADMVLDGLVPGAFDRARIDARDVAIGSAGAAPVRLDRGSLELRPSAQADPTSSELTLEAANLRHPGIDALIGTADPITLGGTARISHLPAWGAALPTLLEAWRTAGGELVIDRIAAAKGSFGLTGTANLHLDAAHRIEGRLDGQFRGLEPIAARLGVPVGAVKLGGLLSSLLGGKKAADGTAQLTLPLIARDGHLFLGPAKTPVTLQPLY